MEDKIVLGWRKSSYSGNGGGNCVEVGTVARAIAIRDTKQDDAGPVLWFSPTAWRKFADQIKCSLPSEPTRTSRGMHGHSHLGLALRRLSNCQDLPVGAASTHC